MNTNYGGLSQLLRSWKYNTARAVGQNSEATSKATPTNSRTSLNRAVKVSVLCLALTGCAGRTGRTILTSANTYATTNDAYAARCVAVYGDGCEPCYLALKGWRRALDDASAAYSRGGKLPSQLDALKTAQKQAEKACQ